VFQMEQIIVADFDERFGLRNRLAS
jgi:hypothetical protein